MNVRDIVSMLDKKYSGANKVACPNEGREVKVPYGTGVTDIHGSMSVNRSGAKLVCGVCGAELPTVVS